MVNRGASNEVEVKETAQNTNANGFNVVLRKPKKAATGGSGADGADVQVTNVPAEYGDADLLKRHHLFGRYGRVVKINVAQGSAKGKVNVVVTYSTSSEAGLAAHCVDGAYLSGQALSAKSSSPSPTTERAVRPSSHDVKHLPQLPKSLQPQPATSSTNETAAAKPSEARKDTQPKAAEAAKNNQQTTTQTQKPVTATLAPGVSAWSKPLTASVKSATAGAPTTSTPTSATPAQNADKTATKTATPAATPATKPQATKPQQANSGTTAAAIVRGNARASPKTQAANGVAANVSLPAALRNLANSEVAFGGDEPDEAPKMSNVLDQPTTSGPFTGKFGAPDANDNKLFDDQAHVNSVLSDSGAIDNTPPRPTEVSHPAYDTITAQRTAPQSYAGPANGLAGQNAGQRGQQRGRPGSAHRAGGRRGTPGGSPALSGQPMVNVPPAIPPVGGPSPPHFNMGRTKLNPEAPEFYPAAARQPVLPGGMPLNPGQYGGMYDPQYPSFPPGGPGQPVPWGYPQARGAPFGAGPRGYYGAPYGYQ